MSTPQPAPQATGRDQVELVLRVLEGKNFPRESPIFLRTLEWLVWITKELRDAQLLERMLHETCRAFALERAELYAMISGVVLPQTPLVANGTAKHHEGSDKLLRSILPRSGWFEWYDEFTSQTESPLAFHVFSSLCVLGAALGRRVYMKMGFFEIFPNWCCVLVGPTGRVKKTSAANIAKGLIANATLCPIMADSITPEALATALARDGGHQLIYAPEFAVLFNRQRYNETLVTRIIRLLDCPRTFEVETVGRGREEIHDVALSFLGCSTPSLFSGATPDMVTSSGFLNRFLIVLEEDTDREYPVPLRGERRLEIKLEETIRYFKGLEGEVLLGDGAFALYKTWYHQRRQFLRSVTDEIQAEVVERGADHLLRTAMLVHIAQHRNSEICAGCFEVAMQLMAFVERNTPGMVQQICKSQRDADSERLLVLLQRCGSLATHSELLRKSRLDAGSFKRAISTLVESHIVEERKHGNGIHLYVLRGEVEA